MCPVCKVAMINVKAPSASDTISSFQTKLEELKQELAQRRQALTQKKIAWQANFTTHYDDVPQTGRVKLDVGGDKFTPALDRLKSQPGVLAEMFSGKHPLHTDRFVQVFPNQRTINTFFEGQFLFKYGKRRRGRILGWKEQEGQREKTEGKGSLGVRCQCGCG